MAVVVFRASGEDEPGPATLKDMAQGKKTHGNVGLFNRHGVPGAVKGRKDTFMGVNRPLGRAGGAGGVDNGVDIRALCLGKALLKLMLTVPFHAQGEEFRV